MKSDTPMIDAFFQEEANWSLTAEQKARHIGDTPELLEEELRSMVTMMRDDLVKIFRGARFDFAGKRLVSRDGSHVLIWSMRDDPNAPESYRNQQTSRGKVTVYRYVGELSHHS